MYGQKYILSDLEKVPIMIDLADYYCALPVLSHSLANALMVMMATTDVRASIVMHSPFALILFWGSQLTRSS